MTTAAEKTAAAAKAKAEKAKAAKFVELAQKRATKAINAIRSIAKLANRGNYIYSEEQVAKLSEVLRQEVIDMNAAFSTTEAAEKGGFEF